MTDHDTDQGGEHAELLADVDAISAGMPNKTVQGILYRAAAAIRALEAKVRTEARRGDMWQEAEFKLRADRDRLAAEVERLKRDVVLQMKWKTECQDELEDIANELPGVAFMDPPDGGSVSIAEQVRRMYAALRERDSEVAALREALEAIGDCPSGLPHYCANCDRSFSGDAARRAGEGDS